MEKLSNERGKGNKRQPDDSVCIDNCVKICSYQKKLLEDSGSEQEFSKAMFHVPEPWSGNLKTAKILFVGSNPSIDLKEKLFPKFESEKWSEHKKNEVVNFFSDRLTKLENLNSRYWKGVIKYAACILKPVEGIKPIASFKAEDKMDIASQIALTEIVHCKSRDETGVPEAAQKCFDIHTKKVIKYFLQNSSGSEKKKTVVFLGATARNIICVEALTDNAAVDRKKIAEYFGVSNQNARFICIPHPSALKQWTSWASGKVYKGLSDSTRKEIIYEELKQYGYSLPS